MTRRTLPAVLGVMIAACGQGSPAVTVEVTGVVRASPTCPVEQQGQECPPAPVLGRVQFAADGRRVAQVDTDAEGRFVVQVPVGSYDVSVDTGAPLPACPTITVVVAAEPQDIVIDCDTGIR
ncbi:MAG: hypothetical protein ACKOA2_01055 [Ilumatobacteraceae bacterium]